MPPFHMFNPVLFWAEFSYTLVVVISCFALYWRTRDLYTLTKHRGIAHFRTAFLFFGLAYASRFLFNVHMFLNTVGFRLPRGLVMSLGLIAIAYLSTMGVLSLLESTLWKRLPKNFGLASHVIALLVALIALVMHSFEVIIIAQAILLGATLMASFLLHYPKKAGLFALYTLFILFWLFNLLVLARGLVPFAANLLLKAASLAIIGFLLVKVVKWTR